MNRYLLFSTVILTTLALGSLSSMPIAFPLNSPETPSQHEVLFTIPIGDEGIHYSPDGLDMLVWGPSAITTTSDGTFWIADTVANRLIHLDSKGVLLGKYEIGSAVIGIGDLEVTPSEIWILDVASLPPKIVHLNLDGEVLNTYDLPEGFHLGDGLSGIALGENNALLIEQSGGARITQFITPDGTISQEPLAGYGFGGKVYIARSANLTSDNASSGYVMAGSTRFEINVDHDLGSIHILKVNGDGSLFVVVEELVIDTVLRVDKTIRHYSSSGKLLGIARIPIVEQYTYVAHQLSVGPDGNVYALVTYPEHAAVLRLSFTSKIDPILSDPNISTKVPEISESISISGVASCVSRDTMVNTAYSYYNNSKYLNNTNINGVCANRTKPRYLGNPGTYRSVSYDWWGFDTVSGWNSYMTNNYQAGDIDTSGNEGCSKGVDCSGYVSRAWQLGSRYGTCTLENISTQLSSVNLLQRGDILNKCNVHTVLFRDFGYEEGGLYVYEATTYNAYDRVVYTWNEWSRFSGYKPRKYNNVCP